MDHQPSMTRTDLECMLIDQTGEPKALPLSLLGEITDGFSDEQQIGEGGFATVYKGVLANGAVAVKRLSNTHMYEKEFHREVECLMMVRHKNVVRFLGYCADTQGSMERYNGKFVMADVQKRLLCFEYLPNGSLDKYINDASGGLDWRNRYQIIKGIIQGLHYLHGKNIVHLDLKPANILLDHNMVPKIADFGLSRCFDEHQTRVMTTKIGGTFGYVAPEFGNRVITHRFDLYSLGVIIIELLTGEKGYHAVENVLESWRARLEKSPGDAQFDQIRVCAEIGIECTKFNPLKRPVTQQIIDRLDEMENMDESMKAGMTRSSPLQAEIASSELQHGTLATTSEEPQSTPPAIKDYGNDDPKFRKSSFERQLENVDALIGCVSKNLGYSAGKPVAAFTIYKCLLHWKSFEALRTSVFDRLIQLIGFAVEKNEDNDRLAYWLSNTSSLFFLVQESFKGARSSLQTSLFGRMAQGWRPASLANLHVVRQVEAKYPALLFKQQLLAYVEKIYGIIRDNIKIELSFLISLCIQAARTMNASKQRNSVKSSGQSQNSHWQKIVENLDILLRILQDNHVTPVLTQKIFTQIFSYINVQLFNSLLLRRECCSFSNGEYVKAGLAELELWCVKATAEYAASSWDEMKHVRQAVGFLVVIGKFRLSYDELVHDLCPILSVQQLYRICTQYWDDKYNTRCVSPNVLSSMRLLMTEDSNHAENSSFLLDDDSSIPFSVEDITNATREEEFSDVKPAGELLENPAFQFLHVIPAMAPALRH